jgi:hypothetical protein
MAVVNWTWVCFDCRQAVRRMVGGNPDVRCPSCAKPCECIGAAKRLPRKIDLKAWNVIREAYYAKRREQLLALESERREIIRQHEQQLETLSRMPPSREREQQIAALTTSLAYYRETSPMPRLSCDMGI